MKYLITYIFFILLFQNIYCESADEITVKDFAIKWLKQNQSYLQYAEKHNVEFQVKSINPIKGENNQLLLYVVELRPVGFLLLNPNTNFNPVVGYSSENNFNYNSIYEDPFFTSMLNSISEKLIKNDKVLNLNKRKTLSDSTNFHISQNTGDEIYGPFLNSDWGQGNINGSPVFNFYSPNNWPIGCVATAMAQVLNYYKWPTRGSGTKAYYDNDVLLSADFENTNYDWDNILDIYQNTSISYENRQAVGLLSYHCAVALEMDFEFNGSTANTSDVPLALQDYLRSSGEYIEESTADFWDKMKIDMLQSQPAIISINSTQHTIGHAAVVDGYFETNNYYHVNPGWYGSNTGWYNIAGKWNMSSYNIVNGAVLNISPNPIITSIEIDNNNSFLISWDVSENILAEKYELYEARKQLGPWELVTDTLTKTEFQTEEKDLNSYYYKVRALINNEWTGFSTPQKIQIGTERNLHFQIDMSNRPLKEGEELVLRGNLQPLKGNENSEPLTKINDNEIYEINLAFDYDLVGEKLVYRYFISSQDTLIPENQNREYVITEDSLQKLPTAYFNNLTGVNSNQERLLTEYKLYQNYPNPFNPSTTINYAIPTNPNSASLQQVKIIVYDILGREVKTLVNSKQEPGEYTVKFDGGNLSTGIYLYQLYSGNFVDTKKMILIK